VTSNALLIACAIQFNPSASLGFAGFSVSDYARNHYD
jgi:hypothetical protein